MSFTAFVLILSSVVLHATWHFMVKQSRSSMAMMLPVSFANLLMTLCFALTSGVNFGEIPGAVFLMAVCGGASGVICNLGLVRAYQLSDVSLAYPLARALPVLFTMAITAVLGIGKPLSLTGAAAMFIIFAGCVIMPMRGFSGFRIKDYFNKSFPCIIIAALGTTGYTIFDSIGVKLFLKSFPELPVWHGSLTYANLRETSLFVIMFLSLALFYKFRIPELDSFKRLRFYCTGIFAGLAYALILAAMPFVTNVSFVQAFRQLSLPVGMLFGVIFLKEKCTAPRIVGVVLTLAGLLLSVVR